ncbi:hypothetical protein [Novosphingobium mangrovi (ex Huang et al. 2023)]|uniref:Uncharacterized protein n=1 Tax=Novosphingobium mangrovi (ex Huang et al. 2023) TaxID=2976432 RepID=A0ABT2I882_9SPHN|nr:hypothetical protein [Novosphingobium mangrovi (ex Huang et al. 2023)]MCT2400984.1 hypothetical protein [Novosphingobium mangrovi (ex Huang et al. 2023)]
MTSSDPKASASSIATLLKQQCLESSDDPIRFDAGLSATGWGFKRVQTADPADPLSLDMWVSPVADVLRGQVVEDNVFVCTVMIHRQFAPPITVIKSALSDIAGQTSGSAPEWWWKSGAKKFHMDVNDQGNEGQSTGITVETYRLPWWQSILG